MRLSEKNLGYKMKKNIKWAIVWNLPNTTQKIKTEYIMEVPNKVAPSFYLWVSTGRRMSYKNQCFINKLKRTKEYVFKNTVSQPHI